MDTIENTSGQGPASQVPPEIRRWNWGAFLLSWIWGIGNSAWLALLVFVPVFGFVWWFVVGAKGSEWAWRARRWESVAQFRAVQRRWAAWGVVALLAGIAFTALFVFGVFSLLKDSEAYKLAQQRLDADARIAEIVGRPVSTGFPMGQIQTSGPRGSASLSFRVQGPQGKGTVFVEAVKDLGAWKIDRMVFEEEGTGRRIDLSPEALLDSREGSV
jgi:hypothetical protein